MNAVRRRALEGCEGRVDEWSRVGMDVVGGVGLRRVATGFLLVII